MTSIQIPAIARALLAAAALFGAAVQVAIAQERVQFPENIDDGKGPTRSEFGEFKVTGANAHIRGVHCDYAVSVLKDYGMLMNRRSRLKCPIIIDLWQAPGNRVKGHPVRHLIVIQPDRYSPTVRVALCESFRFSYLREELIRFFLLEDALRHHKRASELIEERKEGLIPQWLWTGVSEAIDFRKNGEPGELFRNIHDLGRLMTVDEILKAEPDQMTTLSRAVYRASAGGLVLTLLQQDGGDARLRNFIAALPGAPQDQEALIRKYFPGTADSKDSLEKWWAIQAAQLAKPTSLDVLSIAQTEAALAEALQVTVMESVGGDADEEGDDRRGSLLGLFSKRDDEPEVDLPVPQRRVTYGLSQYANFIEREDFDEVVQFSELALTQLSYRSFPLYRPLIKNYLAIISELKDGKTKGVDAAFAALAETRKALAESGRMAEDVLNLYEATEVKEASAAFDDYYRAVERTKRSKPARKDEISKYLDRVQAEHE